MAENRGPKFTIVQLLAVIAMVIFVGIWFAGLRRTTREPANKIKCSSNLRQVALAIKMYANSERGGALPRTHYDPATAYRPVAWTNPDAANPFADTGPQPNDVTAAVFLILRTQEITTDVFICPSPSVTAERFVIAQGNTIQSYSNFRSQAELSYSFHNPYSTEAAAKAGAKWDETLPEDFAIAADINPGVPALMSVKFTDEGKLQRSVNSPNHNYDGQNVLYADAHVEWNASVWAGSQQDHIYTFAKHDMAKTTTPSPANPPEPAGIVGSPIGPLDTVLLPAWDQKIPLP